MRINLKWLREHNYDIQQGKDSIEIYPRDCKPILKALQDEFGIESMYACAIEKDVRDFQILTEIRKGSKQ